MKNSGLIYPNSLSYNEEMSGFIYTAFVGFGNTTNENLEQYQLQLIFSWTFHSMMWSFPSTVDLILSGTLVLELYLAMEIIFDLETTFHTIIQ